MKNINRFYLWIIVGVFLITNIVWIISMVAVRDAEYEKEKEQRQLYQEQVDRLSYIVSLSAGMAVLRKENKNIKDFDPLLQEIVDQIVVNVIVNSIYEFDGKNIVKFDLLDKTFKNLVDDKLIDSNKLIKPLGINEGEGNYRISHNLYSSNENIVKKIVTIDECRKFQKWFHDKIMNQTEKD